jgi:hypothetical protein
MRLFALVLGVVLSVPGLNAPLQAQALVRNALRGDLVGCYALFTGNGKPVDSSFHNASPLVHLDPTSHPGFTRHAHVGVRRLLMRLDPSGRRFDLTDSRHGLAPLWWVDSLTDSVRLSFSDGFGGAFLTLAAPTSRSDTLRGRIEEDWDFTDPTSHRPAYAVRVLCAE